MRSRPGKRAASLAFGLLVCSACSSRGGAPIDAPWDLSQGGSGPGDGGGAPDASAPDGGGSAPHAVCSPDRYCFEHPLPQGNSLSDLHGAGGVIWAAGAAGTLLRYDGKVWTQVPTGFAGNLISVWTSGPSDVWTLGEDGLLHFDGASWTQVSKQPSLLGGIWGSGPSDVWITGGAGAKVARWDGATLTTTTIDPGGNFYLWDIWGSGPKDIYVAGHYALNATSTNVVFRYDGASWKKVVNAPGKGFLAVGGTGPQDVWAGGADGVASRYQGSSWSAPGALTSKGAIRRLWGTASQGMWLTTDKGAILRIKITSTELQSGTSKNLMGIWGADPADVWFAGQDGVLLHSEGGLMTFSNAAQCESAINDIFALSDREVWAVGDKGLVLRSNGGAWTRVPGGTAADVLSVWGSSATDVWVVGADNTVLRWDGAAFNLVPGLPGAPQFYPTAVWGSGAGDVWLAGLGGVVHSDGKVASPIVKPTSERLLRLWGSGKGDVWAAGARGALAHYDGVTWKAVSGPASQDLRGLSGTAADDVWAVGWGVGIYPDVVHFDGVKWSQVRSPALQDTRLGYGVFAQSRNAVRIVGGEGTIAAFDGAAWRSERSGSGAQLRIITGAGGHLYIGGSGGTILHRR